MILIIIALVILTFGGVLFFGAPYLPTMNRQVQVALELANLKPGQTLLELGCGDGKVVLAAARKGVKVVGYELNPLLALIAWLRTRRYRQNVRIIWGNFWRLDWPKADAIFVFLLPRYMPKLNKYIVQYKYKPVKLVSFAFQVPNCHAIAQKSGLYAYVYK